MGEYSGGKPGFTASSGRGKKDKLKRNLRFRSKQKRTRPVELTSEFLFKSKNQTENDIILTYSEGSVELKADGLFGGIEISYKGSASFEADLPENWIFMGNEKKLILINFGAVEIPSVLCKYQGKFKITSARGYSLDGTKMIRVLPTFSNSSNIENLGVIETITSNVDRLYVTENMGEKVKFKIRTINNISKQNEFYYEDGTAIEHGVPIYYNENFQAFTGNVEKSDAKPLFRKDAKGMLDKKSKSKPTLKIANRRGY